jgi:hypothetical protein
LRKYAAFAVLIRPLSLIHRPCSYLLIWREERRLNLLDVIAMAAQTNNPAHESGTADATKVRR